MARRKSTLPVVYSQADPSIQKQSKKPKPIRPRRAQPRKFTIAAAFSPFTIVSGEEGIDVERGLRAVAFLLHSLSGIGNADVNGFAANGLAFVVEHYADRVDATAKRKSEI